MSDSTSTSRLPSGLTTVLVWAYLAVVAWTTTVSAHSAIDLLALAALYALLAVALVHGSRALGSYGLAGRLAGAAIAGLVLAWHWREQTRVEGTGPTLWTLEGIAAFAPVVAVLTGVFLLFEVIRARRADRTRFVAQISIWALASLAFFGLLFVVFQGGGTARWHLLRHNNMIGTVAFHLFGTPVREIEEARWQAHRRGAPIGQPEWVLELYEGGTQPEATGTEAPRPTAGAQPAAEPVDATPPDVVLIMLDTLRADALAAWGGDPTLMPALNDVAAGATVFTDVIANAPWTQPSVASLFTGVLPEEHGVISYPFRMSANVVTLAEVLGAHGYTTAAFNANAVIANPDSGFARGFDTFEYVDDPRLTYARAGTVTDRVLDWLGDLPSPGPTVDSMPPSAAAATPSGDDPALASAAQSDTGRPPLFLFVLYFDPHVPYLSSGLTQEQQASLTFDEARAHYADELRYLDGELARLLGALASALGRPHAVLITSDHGEELGEHGGLGHSQTLYSEVLEVPAMLRLHDTGAAGSAGTVRARLEGRDFFDLLLRLGIGEAIDPGPWAAGRERDERVASLYFEKDPGRSELVHYLLRPYRSRIFNRMIQRDGMRYIWSAFGPTDELYDLAADPAERVNLADADPERVELLRAALDDIPPYWTQLVPLELSPEDLESLRQLGYIR